MAEMTADQQKALALAAARLRLQEQDPIDAAASTAEKPSNLVQVGRGMMDLYQGVKQLGLMAKDAFTGGKDSDAYTKQVGDEIANYEKGRKAGGETGFDWGRLAGNLATPATLLPGGVGANAATRIGTAALAGAAQAGAMFTPEGESKLLQTAGGAVGGGAGAGLVEGVSRGAAALLNKGVNAVARPVIDDAALTLQLQDITRSKGLDWNKLGDTVRSALKTEATAQLQAGNLNPDGLMRVAQAAAVDPRLKLTQGQAMRSPQLWQKEQDLRAIRGVGDDLKTRFLNQGQVLAEAGERIKPANVGPFQAGESAIGAVQQKFAETGDDVSALYKLARDTVGVQSDVPTGPLHGRAMQVLNEFDDVIPSPIKSRLEELGISRMGPVDAKKAFTVEQAEALDKLINKRWDASNKPMTAALTELKGAIKDSLSAIGDDAGTDAAKAFRAAKDAASARFDEFGQKIARSAANDVAPDDFVRKFVMNGDVRDVQALTKTLTTGSPEQVTRGTQALNNVRAAVLSDIFENKGVITDGVLSGAKLDKALRDLGPEKIRAVFSPDQVKQLELLRKVSIDLTKPPPMADINYSRTSSALANLLNSVSKIPGFGMAGKAAQSEVERVQRGAVNAALTGNAALPRPPIQVVSPAAQNSLASRVAPYAVAPANMLMYRGQ